MKYCAYQDRCQKEVRNKLYEIEAPYEAIEEIITTLIADNFLNEERFATSFARGKFYYKHWGRKKIENELKSRSVSSYCIKKGLKEIVAEDYTATLTRLTQKKIKELGGSFSLINKQQTANFLFNKGYESELIWEAIKSLEQDFN